MQKNDIYFWQKPNWQHLIARKNAGNLPHALLFSGIDGLGKFDFAKLFAKFILCRNNNTNHLTFPCQSCSSCQLVNAATHPDLLIIQKDEKEKAIKVEEIRELSAELYQTSQQGGAKVAIINSAESMNVAASNALLKTLEEPPSGVYIFLLSSRQSFLLPTIRSRCQNVIFNAPDTNSAKHWLLENYGAKAKENTNLDFILSLTNNSPFKALEFLQEETAKFRDKLFSDFYNVFSKKLHFTKFAELYLQEDLKFLLLNAVVFISDLIKSKHQSPDVFLINKDKKIELKEIAQLFSLPSLFEHLDKIFEINKFIMAGINLNKQLVLERIAYCS